VTSTGRAAQKVLLLGLRGAGTSTVGQHLSTRLGWPYLDYDTMLVRTTGTRADELRETQGLEALREAESKVLTLMLGMPGPMIGGLPSGLVENDEDRDRLAQAEAHVVWLKASPAVLSRRIAQAAGRVRQSAELPAVMTRLAKTRHPLLEAVAEQVVDTDTLPPGVVAKLVVEALEGPAAG
jgi:shikimate kinase